jgi:RHS repeat-associated protein
MCYVRDASGNVMSIYNDTTVLEQPIYGSSRLGMYKPLVQEGAQTLGQRSYELSNHLGNVLVVITDNIHMAGDSAWTTVSSTSDYYPFGLDMEGRGWRDTTALATRYGFNGKEKDASVEWGSTTYDYGFRIYNPTIAKFLSVDPLTRSYPWYTPYQFAGNHPIVAIDLDGLEEAEAISSGTISKTQPVLDKATQELAKKAAQESAEVGGKQLTKESIKRGIGQNVLRGLGWFLTLATLVEGDTDSRKKFEQGMEQAENYELDHLEQRIQRDGCVSEYEENRYIELMQKRRGIYIDKNDIYKKVTEGSNLKYTPTKKHEKGGWGTYMPLDDRTAQEVLNNSVSSGKQRYGYKDGQVYEFQPDNAGGYHGYPVKGNEVPPSVLKDFKDKKAITDSEYNKLIKGKE